MDIEGLGGKRAEQLVGAGLVTTLSDLYSLRMAALLTMERFGDKSAANLLAAIARSKERPLARFLFALGIPLVGEHISRLLSRNFRTIKELMAASEEELQRIGEVGPEVARRITLFFTEAKNRETIARLRQAGLALENPLYRKTAGPRPLDNLTVVFTGKLERWSRDEAEQLVAQLGGHAAASVSSATNLVVSGPGAGSKLAEARKRNIKIVSEDEFAAMINKRSDE